MVEAFQNLIITVSDGNTVPSIDFLDTKTYPDIGSGNVLKLSWDTPIATDNTVDYYKLYIAYYNDNTDNYKILFNDSIGNINEYYITSNLLSSIPFEQFKLSFQLTAYSRYGASYNGVSNMLVVNIARSCGIYTTVQENYEQPIMKRAIGCAKLGYKQLTDADGKAMLDAAGKVLYTKTSSAQAADSGWTIMNELLSKDSSGTWRNSNIAYEALTDSLGSIVLDSNGDPIYVL